MPSDCCSLGGSSRDILPTLIKATFCPYPPHYCSFAAAIRDSRNDRDGPEFSFRQLARFIENIGLHDEADTATFVPLDWLSRHTPPGPRSVEELLELRRRQAVIHRDATRTRFQHGKAIDGGAIACEGARERSSSDDNGGLDNLPYIPTDGSSI
jgi:hypothetical protein